ncbi:hydroxypyruvate isomerase [Allopseudospirillum japonicum]|uniref:Hydroxypyruvate isomerase n=1 Tax=Allopseudospirillum japonicum TaxID=64971 RepID=A0A1H6Q9Y3_9GAMM|nr:TIM barrel protein [Allopseudospirillum japonicum]SEI37624.1 hydroxypyruvate isomerase [Allopseudospirillum japonicum]
MSNIAANISLLFTEIQQAPARIFAAQAAGFDGFEVQFPYTSPLETWQHALDACPLPLALINVPAGDLLTGGLGLACVPQKRPEFRQALIELKTYATTLKPQGINLLAGCAPAENRKQAYACLADNILRTLEVSSQLDIPLYMEPINNLDMPDFLLNTPEEVADVLALAQVGEQDVGLQYDLYHMARMQRHLCQDLKDLQTWIKHIQFADLPNRQQPSIYPQAEHLDFSLCCAQLKQQGYLGWLAAEYHPSVEQTQNSLDWLPYFRKSL